MSYRIIQRSYGATDVLERVEFPTPTPASDELLVRINAASINPVDAKTRAGGGIARMLEDSFPLALGWDAAGVVEGVGAAVSDFAVGDRVFGLPLFPVPAGTFGTHVVSPAADWAHSPLTIDDIHAAAVPLAALTALKAFREVADLRPGQRVLVRGAGGGVGHFAVQIAKAMGAFVVASASGEKSAFVEGLGADLVVDYSTHNVGELLARSGAQVDVTLELLGGPTALESVAATKPGGLIISVAGGPDPALVDTAAAAGVRLQGTLVSPNGAALSEIATWIEEGKVIPTVSTTYPLDDIALAHARLDAGHVLAKVVVTIP